MCILFILFIGYIRYNNETEESFSYPYYPYMYKYQPLNLKPVDYPNYRNLGNGGLLVWDTDPVRPLYIKCRSSVGANNLCNYIVNGGKQSITSP